MPQRHSPPPTLTRLRAMSPQLARAGGLVCVVAVLAASAWGCGRTRAEIRWEQRVLKAERMFDHRAYAPARAEYEALIQQAGDNEARRDDVKHMRYRLAYIHERQGELPQALDGYMALWKGAPPDDETGGRALFRTGWILYHDLGRVDEALDVWTRTLTLFHDSNASHKALFELLDHHKRNALHAEALVLLAERYPTLARTTIGDNLVYEAGRILHELEAWDEAMAMYQKLIENHRRSGLVDDARWNIAMIYDATERYDDALTQLRLIAENRDASWYVGDYDSAYVDDARYRRGMILLDQLERFGEAEAEFKAFVQEFPESLLRDDARWNIAQARLGRGDGAGAEAACAELARVEPESRWVDDCQALSGALSGGADPKSLRREGAD